MKILGVIDVVSSAQADDRQAAVQGPKANGRPSAITRVRLAVAGDHLARASALTIGATIASSLLGFIYWSIAARVAGTEAVGITAAAISLTTAVSLATALGVNSFLIERLPSLEGTPEWQLLLNKWLWSATLLTAVTAAAVGLVTPMGPSGSVPLWLRVSATTLAASCVTVLGTLDRVFLSARRTELGLLQAIFVGGAKVASLGTLVLLRSTPSSMMLAWSGSVLVSSVVGCRLILPRTKYGRVGGWPRGFVPRGDLLRVVGHHLTSVGGIITPYLLPPLVVYRVDATANAYFYTTWMVGSFFLIISPAVAASLFGEAARDASQLAARTLHAARILLVILPVPILVGVLGGRWILLLFGQSYANSGYLLLAVLAVSAIPDAFTNLAVSVLRVTGKIRQAAALNIAMGAIALGLAWVLLPLWGIIGAGFAWFISQCVGCAFGAPTMFKILSEGRRAR